MTIFEDRHILQRGLLVHAQAQRRKRCWHTYDTGIRERRLGSLAIGFDGIDPKVQRRRLIQRIGQLHRFVLAKLLD